MAFENIMAILRDYGFYIFMGIFVVVVVGKVGTAIAKAQQKRRKKK